MTTMPRRFNPNSERNALKLPDSTKDEVSALILDLDLDFRSVVIRAIHELWQRESGGMDRDVLQEIDELRQRLDAAGL